MNVGVAVRRAHDMSRSRTLLRRYGSAVVSVAVALLLTLLFAPFVQTGISPLFLAAVMFSAWRGGLGPGLVAIILSAFVAAFFLLNPTYSFNVEADDLLQLAVFVFAALIISSLSAARERAEFALQQSLQREHAARTQAEAVNELKDEFIAAVSHELRTPLTTIKTLTRVMLRGEQTEEERREFLEDVSSECDRQIDLVLNLLDLSRIKSGGLRFKLQAVDAGELLGECVKIERIEAEEHRHTLVTEIPQGLPPARADRSALRRALCTIMENAIKYTPDGGTITLSAESVRSELRIHIADTGRGIRAEELPHIFDKFYRGRTAASSSADSSANGDGAMLPADDALFDTDEFAHASNAPDGVPGIGLGLYLAQSIVEQLDGRISVESAPQSGSTFTVHLPLWSDATNDATSEGVSVAARDIKRKIQHV